MQENAKPTFSWFIGKNCDGRLDEYYEAVLTYYRLKQIFSYTLQYEFDYLLYFGRPTLMSVR